MERILYARVIVDIASSQIDKIFDYSCDPSVVAGMRVRVPFGNRYIEGIVIEVTDKSDLDPKKIKSIASVLDDLPVISEEQFFLADFMRKKYHIGYSDVFRLFLPSEVRSGKVGEIFETSVILAPDFDLEKALSTLRKNASNMKEALLYLDKYKKEAQTVLNKKFGNSSIKSLVDRGFFITEKNQVIRTPYGSIKKETEEKHVLTKKQNEIINTISSNPDNTFLIHGITGSGKTEVYMNIIERTISDDKTAIMLVPEISLTPQIMSSFRNRFGESVALLHSGISAGERYDEWKRILLGAAKIVVGARSAIFAPLKNIGAIIIDEEHENSYVSETNPRYTTSEVAEARRQFNACTLILGSATPSIETYHKAITGKYKLLEMKERINKQKLPPIKIVDMGTELRLGNPGVFSNALKYSLEKCISDGNQAILFINRRGFSSFMQCRDCGWVAKCPDCDVSLVYHKVGNRLKCHYCGNRYHVFDICPECSSENLKTGAIGTQRIVEELYEMFPKTKILRMDNDTTQTKNAHYNILNKFRNKEAQILVGTQMVAKGHDFPSVTLVGIIDPDLSLHHSAYTSTEKTFSLITQVAGRAGRAEKLGEIILQTYSPRHYVYRMASVYDYIAFYNKEINIREVTKYPPFSQIVRILFTSEKEELAIDRLKVYYDYIDGLRKDNPKDFYYLNKMKSPITRIKNKYRYQILMRLSLDKNEELLDKIFDFDSKNRNKNVLTFIETNPQNLS